MTYWLRFWWETRGDEHGHLSVAATRYWLRRLDRERER